MRTWASLLSDHLPPEWLARLADDLPWRIECEGRPVTWRGTGAAAEGTRARETYRADGLPLELDARLAVRPANRAAVVSLRLHNTGASACPPITRVEPLRLCWDAGRGPVHVRTAGGGPNEWFYPPRAFRIETIRSLRTSWLGLKTGYDGRSSNEHLPLMAVADGDLGAVCSLEWSGPWYLDFIGGEGARSFVRGGVPVRNLVLEAGERLDLPAAHYVFADGGLDGAGNAFRRYMRECVLPDAGGERVRPAQCYNHWFGIGPDVNEGLMLRLLERAKRLGVEFFVLDAGWYAGCTPNDFSPGVGNWERVDAAKFPNGLEPLARAVRDAGLGFGLWFEPERAHRDSHWAREHPDWFWDIGGPYLHVNLTMQEPREAIVSVIGDAIERLDLAWVKWDYNVNPLPYWERADPSGKVVFRYMEGLYATLDTLLTRYPHVRWECCASGGRRMDLGTLRRAHATCMSDHANSAAICRAMQTGASHFLPGNLLSGGIPRDEEAGVTSVNEYGAASRLIGLPTVFGAIQHWTDDEMGLVRRMLSKHRSFRHLLVQDFWPLTPRPRDEHDPDAVEFCAYDGREALVAVYSYGSAVRDLVLRPRGLRADLTYTVRTVIGRGPRCDRMSGAELRDAGLPVSLDRESALFLALVAEDG